MIIVKEHFCEFNVAQSGDIFNIFNHRLNGFRENLFAILLQLRYNQSVTTEYGDVMVSTGDMR